MALVQWHSHEPELPTPTVERITLDARFEDASAALQERLLEFASHLESHNYVLPEALTHLVYRYMDQNGMKRPPPSWSRYELFVRVASLEELRYASRTGRWLWDRVTPNDPGPDCFGRPASQWVPRRMDGSQSHVLNGPHDPVHSWGVTRVNQIISGRYTTVYERFACCGKELTHPGCWTGEKKYELVPYNVAPYFRERLWTLVKKEDWNAIQALWENISPKVGTKWIPVERYDEMDSEIQTLKKELTDELIESLQAMVESRRKDPWSIVSPLFWMNPFSKARFEQMLNLVDLYNKPQCTRPDDFFDLSTAREVLLDTLFPFPGPNTWSQELDIVNQIIREQELRVGRDLLIRALKAYVEMIQEEAIPNILRLNNLPPVIRELPQFRPLRDYLDGPKGDDNFRELVNRAIKDNRFEPLFEIQPTQISASLANRLDSVLSVGKEGFLENEPDACPGLLLAFGYESRLKRITMLQWRIVEKLDAPTEDDCVSLKNSDDRLWNEIQQIQAKLMKKMTKYQKTRLKMTLNHPAFLDLLKQYRAENRARNEEKLEIESVYLVAREFIESKYLITENQRQLLESIETSKDNHVAIDRFERLLQTLEQSAIQSILDQIKEEDVNLDIPKNPMAWELVQYVLGYWNILNEKRHDAMNQVAEWQSELEKDYAPLKVADEIARMMNFLKTAPKMTRLESMRDEYRKLQAAYDNVKSNVPKDEEISELLKQVARKSPDMETYDQIYMEFQLARSWAEISEIRQRLDEMDSTYFPRGILWYTKKPKGRKFMSDFFNSIPQVGSDPFQHALKVAWHDILLVDGYNYLGNQDEYHQCWDTFYDAVSMFPGKKISFLEDLVLKPNGGESMQFPEEYFDVRDAFGSLDAKCGRILPAYVWKFRKPELLEMKGTNIVLSVVEELIQQVLRDDVKFLSEMAPDFVSFVKTIKDYQYVDRRVFKLNFEAPECDRRLIEALKWSEGKALNEIAPASVPAFIDFTECLDSFSNDRWIYFYEGGDLKTILERMGKDDLNSIVRNALSIISIVDRDSISSKFIRMIEGKLLPLNEFEDVAMTLIIHYKHGYSRIIDALEDGGDEAIQSALDEVWFEPQKSNIASVLEICPKEAEVSTQSDNGETEEEEEDPFGLSGFGHGGEKSLNKEIRV